MTRYATFILLAFAVAACGQPLVKASSTARYTVTASLMQKPGEDLRACTFIPLPLPPIGCGGVSISGLDILTLPDETRYRNGVVSAGTYRLVGTWGSGQLVLTAQPSPARANDLTPMPSCSQDPYERSPTDTPQGQRLMADSQVLKDRGIEPLQFYMCRQVLFVVVAVADQPTVDFMTSRYAPASIAGWLHPVP